MGLLSFDGKEGYKIILGVHISTWKGSKVLSFYFAILILINTYIQPSI